MNPEENQQIAEPEQTTEPDLTTGADQTTEPVQQPEEVEPVPVEYEYEGFVDPTPSDIVDKSDILIFLQQQEIKVLEKQLEQEKTLLEDANKKLQTLVTQGSEGDSTLSDTNGQILTKLDSIVDQQQHLISGSDTIVTYGVFYIPFAIILFLLWRFFATFIRKVA
ncbi:hypothetical protein [Metabacillus sp. SLBN-84]